MVVSWGSQRRGAALALGALLLAAPALSPAVIPARAVELQGQTWFAKPPWKVVFRNYYWYVMQAGGEYYFTLTLPEQAGVGLGGLLIQQTRGVDRQFPLMPERSRAFLGQPRREGVGLEMVDGHKGLAPRKRQRLAGGEPHHDPADEAGPCGRRDPVEIREGHARRVEGAAHQMVQQLHMEIGRAHV